MTTPAPDEKLRDLERRWKQSGSPDDEAAYLLERVRVGDLTQERLELAAYCGHEGARRACRTQVFASVPHDLEAALTEIDRRFGRRATLQATLGVIQGVRNRWEDSPSARMAVAVASSVLAGGEPVSIDVGFEPDLHFSAWNGTSAAYRFYEAVTTVSDSDCLGLLREAVRLALRADCGLEPDATVAALDGPPSAESSRRLVAELGLAAARWALSEASAEVE